jgi:hypothetical protein
MTAAIELFLECTVALQLSLLFSILIGSLIEAGSGEKYEEYEG